MFRTMLRKHWLKDLGVNQRVQNICSAEDRLEWFLSKKTTLKNIPDIHLGYEDDYI